MKQHGVTWGVQERMSIFLAVKVSFRVTNEEIKKNHHHTVVFGLNQLGTKNGLF